MTRFRGMFAFVLWDRREERVFAARDRLGIKPLHYYTDDKRFVFGSEIKAILACPEVPKSLRADAAFDYFHFMYVPGPKTIFKGIHKFRPGHILALKKGSLVEKEYWDISFAETQQLSEAQWCRRIITNLPNSWTCAWSATCRWALF
ncbi:nucleophile aminohydrolases n-terminal [Desulfoluna spongiiphila]|nr:nucleophile aminohydrolases n-terminal [Desulfoluna spongiiphila]